MSDNSKPEAECSKNAIALDEQDPERIAELVKTHVPEDQFRLLIAFYNEDGESQKRSATFEAFVERIVGTNAWQAQGWPSCERNVSLEIRGTRTVPTPLAAGSPGGS